MIGQTISHYKIVEKLGEGGMGVVYKAEDTNLKRTVALKFLPHHLTANETEKARFLQEAQAAATINHPNVCTIYDIKEENGQQFIVMEFVEGRTLRAMQIETLKPETILAYATQIGDALQEAHSKGIIHRDIKADNIMVNLKHQIKVMDFGLAKLKGSLKLTRTSSTVGTLAYMSPEQIQGGEADARSDIFSFGVVLYEMLTGRTPFRGEHDAAMMYSIINEDPEPMEKFKPNLSPVLINLIQRTLEKDPNDRYQSVHDMVIELRRLQKQSTKVSRQSLAEMPVMMKPPEELTLIPMKSGEESKPSVSSPSKKKYWIGIGALSLLAVFVAAYFLFLKRESPIEINPGMTTRILEIPLTDIRYHGLSGDGNWAAFPAKDAGGNWHIYFMNTSGGEPKAITTDSMSFINSSVDVSLDGSRVAYDGTIPGSNNRGDIFLTSALGGGTRMIAQGGGVPRWQPDGKRIFFFRFASATASKKLEIWSVTPDGTEERREFIDSISVSGRISLSVSPDGKSVVWIRTFPDGNYQEVVIRDLASGTERQITFNKKNIDEVCWTSNNQIIFSSNKSDNTNLWMTPAEGGQQVQITKGLGPDLGMKISTDLKKLLYYESQSIGDFWIGSLETGTSQQVTFDDRSKFSPTLSLDGKIIAFVMNSADPLNVQNAIYVSNRDGSNRRQLASITGMLVFAPNWSLDGTRISYDVFNRALPFDSSAANKAYVSDAVRTGAPKLIADGFPSVWLNADSLLLTNGGKTWLASIATGQVTQFFEDSTSAFPLPGGKYVVYDDIHKSIGGTWTVEVDASFKRKGKARRLDGRKDGYTLTDVSRLRDYFLFKKPGGKLLKVLLPSLKEEPIPGTFSNLDNVVDISLNPMTKEIIYRINRTKGKLVMIENLFK